MASPPEAGNNNTSPPADSSPPPPPTPSSPPESSPATPTTPPSEPSTSPPPPSQPTASPPPPSEPSTSPPPPSEPSTSPPPPSGKSTSPPSPSPPSPPSPETPTQSPPPENSNTPTTPADSPPPASNEGDPQTSVPALPHSPPPPPRRPSSKHSPPPSSSSENNDFPIILGIIFGGLVILLLLVIFLKWRKSKKRQYYGDHGLPIKVGDQYHKGPRPPMQMDPNAKYHPQAGMGYPYPVPSSEFSSGPYGAQVQSPTPNKVISSFGSKYEFSYEALAAATNEFAQANLLGQGGFGYVHKGVLPDGTVVAVKSLKAGSGQGEREFQAEVEIISRVHHRYLVTLVGYCIAGQQRMLVYEYVPNNTLEFHLHGEQVMDWASRRRIAVGSAKGLAYLHEDCHPRIIHRDIKSANILLDFNFEAKVADFGLAKLTTDNYTHVSTRVMGTFGYLAPEYAASGKLTEKSDVFSFGVMLLEIITGRRPIDPTNIMEDSLVDWARPLMTKALETGDFGELLDPRLGDKYDPQEMARMITCAAASIRHSARKRPRMSQIVRALDGNASLEDLNEGVKPGESAMYNPYNTGAYNSDIMRFRKMVLSAEDFNSGPSEPTQSAGDSGEMGLESPIQKPMQ